MDLRKAVFSGIFYTISGNFFTGILTFLSVIIIARALGPTQFGAFMLLMTIANFIIYFSDVGIVQGLKRYIPEIYAKKQDWAVSKLFFEGAKVRILVAVLSILVLWIFIGPLNQLLQLDPYVSPGILLIISLYIIFFSINLLLEVVLLNVYEQKFMNILNVIVNIFFVIALLLIYLYTDFSLKHVLTIFLLKNIVMAVMLSIKSRKIIVFNKDIDHSFFYDIRSRFWSFNKILFITFILQYVVAYTSDNYFLAFFLSLQAVAFYSLAYNFSNNVFSILLPLSLSDMLRATMIRQYKEHGLTELQKMFRYALKFYTLAMFPIAIGGAILSKELILLFYGREYAAAAPILSAFLLLLPAFKILNLFSTIIYAFEKQKVILQISLLGVLNIILNILLIPRFGVFGAVAATSFTLALITLVLYAYSYKLAKIELPKKSIGKCFFASTIMGILVYLMSNSLNYELLIKVPLIVIVGGGIYFITLVLLRILDKEDVKVLEKLNYPIANKFLKFYELIEY